MFCHITQNWRGRPLVRVDDHTARWAPASRALPLDRHGERRPTLSIDGRRVRSCAQSPCWADCTTSTRWRRQLRPCNTSRLAAEPFAIPAQPFKVSIPPQQTRFLRSTGSKYRPITSAALVSKSGSLETMWVSRRCGRTPCLRLAPDALNGRERHIAEFGGQLATAPMRRVILGQMLQCPVEHPGIELGHRHLRRATRMHRHQSSEPLCLERRSPLADELVVAGELASDFDGSVD